MPLPQAPKPPSPRPRRRFARILGITAAVIAGLVVAALVAVHTPPARRYLLDRVQRLLEQQQIALQSEALDYNLFDLSVDLRNITVGRAAGQAPPFATIQRARVDLSLFQLVRGRYVVESATLDGVAVHYLVDRNGIDNLPLPPASDEAAEPVEYLVERLRADGLSLRYENQQQDIDVAMPATSVAVDGHALTDRHTLTLETTQVSARTQDRVVRLDRVAGTVDLGADDVRIERLEGSGEGAEFLASGTITGFAAPVADLTLRASLDSARAVRLAGIDEDVRGQVAATATIRGALAAPTVDATVTSAGLGFRTLDGIAVSAAGHYDVAGQVGTLQRLRAQALWGTVSVEGVVSEDPAATSRVLAYITAFEPATVMQALDLGVVVATRVDARVNLSWPGVEVVRSSGNAQVFLTPTAAAAGVGSLPVGGRLDVTGRDGTSTVDIRRLTAASTSTSGRVVLDAQRRLRGTLRTDSADIGRTVIAAERFLERPAGALLPTPVHGAVAVASRLDGTLDAPVVAVTVDAPGLAAADLKDIAVTADAVYRTDAVRLAALDVRWGGAAINARGTIGLTGQQPLDLQVTANGVDLPAVLAAADAADVPVRGRLTADGVVTGTVARPEATMRARVEALEAYGEHLGLLTARATLAGQTVTLPELRLDKPQPDGDGTLQATGRYALDTAAYVFDLQSSNLQLLTATLPDGRAARGTLDVRGAGAGTVGQWAGDVSVAVADLRVDDMNLGGVVIDASVKDTLATVRAAAEAFRVSVDGTIGVDRPYPSTVTARVDGLDLAALPIELDSRLEGIVRATMTASGDLVAPMQGQAAVTLEAFEGRFNDHAFTATTRSPIRLADERVTIDGLHLTAEDSVVDIGGELALSERVPAGVITLQARANLATLGQYAPPDLAMSADGALAIEGTVRGSLVAIEPDLTITLDDGLLIGADIEPGLSGVYLRARIAEGMAAIERLSASWGTAQFEGSGRVPFAVLPELPVALPRATGPATFAATVRGLNPATVPGAPPGLSGLISVEASVAATSTDLATVEGRVAFPDLQLAFDGLTLAHDRPTVITIGGGTATLEPTTLAGSAGTFSASGTVGLLGDRVLDLTATGSVAMAALATFTDGVSAEGQVTLDVKARGAAAAPELTGLVAVDGGRVAVDEPRVAAENIRGRVELAGTRLQVASLTADVNGGQLTASGGMSLVNGELDDVDFRVTTTDFAFDAPLELRSLSAANLRLSRRGDEFVIDGLLTIDEAGMTGDINFDTGLLASITAPRTLDLTVDRNPMLERVRLDVQVRSASPIVVDNNLARAEAAVDVRVVGTPYEMGLSGQLDIAEGGEVTLNERRYSVTRGTIAFIDDRRIVPSFDLELGTSVRNYDVTLRVTGPAGDTETTLTSDPALPEPDIMAMLVTGRALDEMRGEEYDVAREQVLSYLTGRVGSSLGRGLENATGLTDVRIEPNLIASEADPSARLTVGQALTDALHLVYSTNLTDSSDQIWQAQYDVTRRFQTQATRQSDNTYRTDFRHDVRFGGLPEPRRLARQRPTITGLQVVGDEPLPDADMRKLLHVKVGDDLNYFALRDGVEDLETRLRERNFLQSRVRLTREVDATSARLQVTVTAGPAVDLRVEGMAVPEDVVDEVRLKWHRGVFDAQRIDDAAETVRGWLMRERYLQPAVEATVNDAGDRRQVLLQVTPGPRYDRVVLVFEGASAIPPDDLDSIVDDQDLETRLFTDPLVVTELLRRYYREQGYLTATLDLPRYEYQGTVARVIVAVQEGPLYRIRGVSAGGNTVLATALLMQELPVVAGDPFLPFAAENALRHIRDLYWRRGYNDATTDYTLTLDRDRGAVDVAFAVREGAQSVVADIAISGNDRTSDRLVREQLEVQPSQPLDLAALSRARRALYDTGAFSVAEVRRQPLDAAAADAAGTPQDAAALEGVRPVRIEVNVREVQPFRIRYGVSFDNERGLGGILDAANHNSLGKARVVGLRSRYDAQLREGRIYMNQPSLTYLPVELTASLYYREERNPGSELTAPFNVDRHGVSVQGESTLRSAYVWNYGYRYERSRNSDPDSAAPGAYQTVAPLTSTFTREQRDDLLDASRGSFTAHAFSYSPTWLGSTQSYVRYLGQYFHYFPLQAPRRKRFTTETLRPRLVFAAGVRVGLARGLGGAVPLSERFFAGGSTTLRGFAQNAVGPIGTNNTPEGGTGMLVMNAELRAPLVSIVDGVVFADVGNVYARVQDVSLSQLRASSGLGLRVRTPWFLLRGDYGLVLDPRQGERRGRFFFSIGQAF